MLTLMTRCAGARFALVAFFASVPLPIGSGVARASGAFDFESDTANS